MGASMSVLRNIQRKIFKFSGGFFANWLPPDFVEVGDFGFVKNEKFQRAGSLSDLGMTFDIEETKKRDGRLQYADGVRMTFSPSVKASSRILNSAKASVSLEFSRSGAFVYHLAGINQRRFQNRPQFFKELAAKMLAGEVELGDDAVLIDETRTADKATIIVSQNKKGKFDIQTTISPENSAFLATAKGKIAATHMSGNFLEWIAADSTIPLIHPVRPVFTLAPGGPTPLEKILQAIKSALGRSPMIDEIDLQYHITSPFADRFEFQIKAANLFPSVEFKALSIEDFVSTGPELITPAETEEFMQSAIKQVSLPSAAKYESGAG